MGGEDLHAARFQRANGITNGTVGFHFHPTVAACGGRGHSAHAVARPDGVHFMHTNGIGGADNGGDVMRFVHLLHADRQIRLTPGEHFADSRITLCIH